MAMRVPVPDGSVTDLVVELNREVTKDEVNAAFRAAAEGPLKGYLVLHRGRYRVLRHRGARPRRAPSTPRSTLMTFGNQVKVIGWYDNEWGYSSLLT